MERNYFRLSCLAVFVAVLALASACKGATDGQPVRNTGHYAIIETERGTVVVDFVVQGGDPDGTGMGGPGYNVPAEIDKNEHHLRGSLATARKGDEANPQRESSGSQFYVCLAPQPGLDGDYTIFGGVIKGMDVVDQIQKGDHMKKITLAKEPPK